VPEYKLSRLQSEETKDKVLSPLIPSRPDPVEEVKSKEKQKSPEVIVTELGLSPPFRGFQPAEGFETTTQDVFSNILIPEVVAENKLNKQESRLVHELKLMQQRKKSKCTLTVISIVAEALLEEMDPKLVVSEISLFNRDSQPVSGESTTKAIRHENVILLPEHASLAPMVRTFGKPNRCRQLPQLSVTAVVNFKDTLRQPF